MDRPIWNSIWRRWIPMFGLLGSGLAGIGAFYQVMGLALFGAFIAAFSTILSAVRQAEFRERMEDVNGRLLNTQNDLIIANLKLLSNSEEHTNLITGGDSFAYLIYLMGSEDRAVILHQGKYPLYDLTVRFVDLDLLQTPMAQYLGTTVQIGGLHRSAALTATVPIDLSGKTSMRANIFFTARNGFWSQEIRGMKIADEWAFASRVRRTHIEDESKILFEGISPTYPLNANGEVDW